MRYPPVAISAALMLFGSQHAAQAQEQFPNKPVRMIVGFTPGSEIDIVARMLAEPMSERWGQRVIVDNRTGAGGTVAAAIVARAAPDGYTWLFNSVAHTASLALYSKLTYHPVGAFSFVSQATSAPNVLITAHSQGVKSVGALIALARAKPGQLTYGAAGIGSGTHINGTLFSVAADIQVANVSYKGTPELVTDTFAGRIHYSFSPIGGTVAFVKDGRLAALGVTTLQRSPALPDVPTIAETALPGFEWDQWYGMFMPAATPRAIVEQVNNEMKRILALPATKERLSIRGAWPNVNTPQQFEQKVRAEIDKVTKALAVAGVQPQ
ncbi:MAG: tripartite tricarboxylate transporter substrate binding protein [Burkholderiales bacterium]|nr:tripartite tricarboxylate transporter substrate binding protein [Burkholderiales bacterium]